MLRLAAGLFVILLPLAAARATDMPVTARIVLEGMSAADIDAVTVEAADAVREGARFYPCGDAMLLR